VETYLLWAFSTGTFERFSQKNVFSWMFFSKTERDTSFATCNHETITDEPQKIPQSKGLAGELLVAAGITLFDCWNFH
jgi:hypothetical protein